MTIVDVKKEMDTLFDGLADVTTFIGVGSIRGPGGLEERVAIARILFAEDCETRPWRGRLRVF